MRLALESGFKQIAEALIEDPLCGRGCLRARCRKYLDPALDRAIQLLRTDDFVREPLRPRDVPRRPGEQQLACARLAEQMWQEECRPVREDEADLDLRRHQPDPVRAYAQVAGGGELECPADAPAVDRADDRQGRAEHDARQVLETADRVGPGLLRTSDCGLEIVARGPVLASAAKHYAASVGIARGPVDRIGDGDHRLEVPRVAA